MSKFHHTIGRRDFMKALGLAGVGIGTVAATSPVFHDMDEVISSSKGTWKPPWWVKEVDKPTADVDWDLTKRFDFREASINMPVIDKTLGPGSALQLYKTWKSGITKNIQEAKPGRELRDYALHDMVGRSNCYGMKRIFVDYEADDDAYLYPSDHGVSRWEGTPEEATKMMRAVARLAGARDIGVMELDEKGKTSVYSIERDGKEYVFENCDRAYWDDHKRVIPEKDRWCITFTTMESQDMSKRVGTAFCETTVMDAYNVGGFVAQRLQVFLRMIGYECLTASIDRNTMVEACPGLTMGGVAELSRLGMTSATPTDGPGVRAFKVITDLPMAVGKPIDMGIFEFCKTCGICADVCPESAIWPDDPTWDVSGTWNKAGIFNYPLNGVLCRKYQFSDMMGCGRCRAACPFLTKDFASIHEFVIKPVVAKTSIFNSFFRNMSSVWGYDSMKSRDNLTGEQQMSWWDIENAPVHYIDTTRGCIQYQ